MSNRRNQIVFLTALLVVFLVIVYRATRSPEAASVVSRAAENFRPIAVENPALRLDLLERLKKLQYEGSHRNIFSSSAPPPPVSVAPSVAAVPPPVVGPASAQGPAPLVVPATFYGYVTDRQTGARRAFFIEGDNVYVLAVGELLLGRFRLMQIGNSSVELEETSTGRRATLTMEEPTPS
jgi:hypothetical protein